MAHCINPNCPNPENPAGLDHCQACGTSLLLNGRYEIMLALGQGGFGATFLARNRTLPGHPRCVIKQLRPTSTAENVLKMAQDLFQREAATLGKIGNHPQIPTLLDYFVTNLERTEFYLVQEFIQGLTLHQEVKRGGPFSELAVKQMLLEILPVIDYVHNQQVIHRDIKPANIIRRSQDKKLVLIDFGAVKDQVNPVAASASEQTALTSYAIGTPGYAPPEQMAMRPVYSSDIYALGVTCVYLLTGKSPKDLNYNPATGEIMWQHFVDASPGFIEILRNMLEVSVKHRYQSAQEVMHALSLEPYLDSLSQGMMTQSPPRPSTGEPTNSGGSQSSPFSRQAEAIRAQRARRGEMAPRPDVTQIRSSNSVRKPGTPAAAKTAGKPTGGIASVGNSVGQTAGGPRSQPNRLHPLELQKRYDRGDRDFPGYDFRLANLQRLILAGSNFHEACFLATNLQGADLSHAKLGHANLGQARLKGANLANAYLSHANLQESDLGGANLTNAYLVNANLRGANLAGANLKGAKVSDEQLSQAKLGWNTVFPNGRIGGFCL